MVDTILKLVPAETAAKPRPSSFVGALRRRKRFLLMVVVPIAVLVAGALLYVTGGRYVSTDDAYVHAAKLMVSTDVSGIVSSVDVHEGETVKAGDVLFLIDPKQFQIALDNAKANLEQTALSIRAMKQDYARMQNDVAAEQAQVQLDQTTFDRNAALLRSATVSQSRATIRHVTRSMPIRRSSRLCKIRRRFSWPGLAVTPTFPWSSIHNICKPKRRSTKRNASSIIRSCVRRSTVW